MRAARSPALAAAAIVAVVSAGAASAATPTGGLRTFVAPNHRWSILAPRGWKFHADAPAPGQWTDELDSANPRRILSVEGIDCASCAMNPSGTPNPAKLMRGSATHVRHPNLWVVTFQSKTLNDPTTTAFEMVYVNHRGSQFVLAYDVLVLLPTGATAEAVRILASFKTGG